MNFGGVERKREKNNNEHDHKTNEMNGEKRESEIQLNAIQMANLIMIM